MRRTAQQINGREGETATLFGRCPLNFSLRGGGFAPRHLSRSVCAFEYNAFDLFGLFIIKTEIASGFQLNFFRIFLLYPKN